MTITKRQKIISEQIEVLKAYPLKDAISLIQSLPKLKFNESLDISVNLGVDSTKSDQNVRGSSSLPHGIGKTSRVAVFAEGPEAAAAKKAGADLVGYEDLVEDIKKGNMNFDVLIATPDAMKILGALGQILGPKGLMPNPKVGTVTPEPEKAVKNAKAGQVQYRTDKAGIIHCSIGRASFDEKKLHENLTTLIDALNKAKPESTKGVFIKKVSVSSTMGVGVKIDQNNLSA